MQYRELGKTGVKVSALGFGAMRMPTLEGSGGKVDEKEAVKMIRRSIDGGVNYLDTAYPYHGGQSEKICAMAMRDGYREKVYITTKLPSWDIKTYEDMARILDEQLANLEVSCIDFYLLHSLTSEYWKNYQKLDYKKFLRDARKAGKIKYAGFSYHDEGELFKEIIDDFEWDFCQIQLNYMDEHYQAGLEGLKYASDKGLGVVIMEPLRGGMLARTELPSDLKAIWDEGTSGRTPAEWALRYLWDKPEVNLVLSGMSTMEQVEENLKTANDSPSDSLTVNEKNQIARARDFFLGRIRVNCTNCRYCMPCPAGVNIPELFWGYNHDAMFDDFEKGKFWTTGFIKPHARAYNCVECGQCEEHCPQNISIMEHLKKITELYGRGE